jgi:integrase
VGYKLFPPGSRRNNRTYIVRGSIGGRSFEARTDATLREDAEKWAIDYIAGLKSEAVSGPDVTFEQAANAYLRAKRLRKQDQEYIRKLKVYFRDTRIADMVGDDLFRAADALAGPTSDANKNRAVIGPASHILHYASEQGWCNYRRHRRLRVSRRSKRKPAAPETMRLLLANTDGPKRLLLAWLYETGQRITDSVSLVYGDLDLQAGRAIIHSSKNDDSGDIALSPELVAMLATAKRYPNDKVFPWKSRHSVYKWLTPLCDRLGVVYTPHMSRHALATELRALGLDMKAIAERGVWRDERSASRYVHHRSTDTAGRTVGKIFGQKPGKQ